MRQCARELDNIERVLPNAGPVDFEANTHG